MDQMGQILLRKVNFGVVIVFPFVPISSMDPSNSKRSHVSTGTTPHKPAEKRPREGNRRIRKPLNFSSENVPGGTNTVQHVMQSPSTTPSCRVTTILKLCLSFFTFYVFVKRNRLHLFIV